MIRAVIVGINNYPAAPLTGCVNDADDVIQQITTLGARTDQITKLYDERATKAAIMTALRDMIRKAAAGDHLLFHYSGHGSQVLSQDVSEADGLDECLCPVDFTFDDPGTALRDKELAPLLASVPDGIAMTVVLDSCHSGDFRLLLASHIRKRAFPMPAELISKINREGLRVRPKQRGESTNTVVVSACQSNETAADTVFDNRPNGAFTYYWLKQVATRGSIASALDGIRSSLATFGMHPQIDGSVQFLQPAPFVTDPAPLPRAAVTTPAQRAMTVLFDETWHGKVLGMDFAVDLRIGLADGTFQFDLTNSAGIPMHWSFAVSGDMQQTFAIGLGFQIVLAVRDWQSSPTAISFRLAIQVAPPFLSAVTLVDQEVTVPLPPADRDLRSPTSAADLLAMIELAKLNVPQTPARVPPPVLPRDGDSQWTGIIMVEPFAGGLFGCRYEKSTDNNAFIPPGFIRDHVEVTLDPPNSGNVYFLHWDDSDPHIAKFDFHVGCAAFGGGKATFFLHCVRDPNVIRELPAAERRVASGNGQRVDHEPTHA